jgi:hypothetical protein
MNVQPKGPIIGAVIGVAIFSALHLLPHDEYKLADEIMGAIVFAAFLGGSAWVLFWVVRLRRWRRKQALKQSIK